MRTPRCYNKTLNKIYSVDTLNFKDKTVACRPFGNNDPAAGTKHIFNMDEVDILMPTKLIDSRKKTPLFPKDIVYLIEFDLYGVLLEHLNGYYLETPYRLHDMHLSPDVTITAIGSALCDNIAETVLGHMKAREDLSGKLKDSSGRASFQKKREIPVNRIKKYQQQYFNLRRLHRIHQYTNKRNRECCLEM